MMARQEQGEDRKEQPSMISTAQAKQLGVTKDWVSRIVKAVGNYGESFDRNVGAGSKLGIARGLNQLWNKGGVQYAPPIR